MEFRRVWRKDGVALLLGRSSDPILTMLKHPLADTTREKAWVPPGEGFVQAESTAFAILDSIICELTKLVNATGVGPDIESMFDKG